MLILRAKLLIPVPIQVRNHNAISSPVFAGLFRYALPTLSIHPLFIDLFNQELLDGLNRP